MVNFMLYILEKVKINDNSFAANDNQKSHHQNKSFPQKKTSKLAKIKLKIDNIPIFIYNLTYLKTYFLSL